MKSREKKRKEGKSSVSSAPLKGLPQNITYGDIRIATNNIAAENLIGKGGFEGCVQLQHWHWRKRHSRCQSPGLAAKHSFQEFHCRMRSFEKCQASELSEGYNGEEFKALVMQFMPNGNLDVKIHPKDEESGSFLTLMQRLNIATDVASAMDYLHHGCDPPIVKLMLFFSINYNRLFFFIAVSFICYLCIADIRT